MSCYACGGQLRYPTKLVREPLRDELVSVCNGQCGAQLYKLRRKIARNMLTLARFDGGEP